MTTMDLFGGPLLPEEITRPTYWEDAECLKQVKLNKQHHDYQRVDRQFVYCRTKHLYCKLAIWRDEQWTLFYSSSGFHPWDKNPFPGQLEAAYRASKERHYNYFDLDDGRPSDGIRRAA